MKRLQKIIKFLGTVTTMTAGLSSRHEKQSAADIIFPNGLLYYRDTDILEVINENLELIQTHLSHENRTSKARNQCNLKHRKIWGCMLWKIFEPVRF